MKIRSAVISLVFTVIMAGIMFAAPDAWADTEWSDQTVTIDRTMTLVGSVNVTGDVTLRVEEGATLTVEKGIKIDSGATLEIVGQGTIKGGDSAEYVIDNQSYIESASVEKDSPTLTIDGVTISGGTTAVINNNGCTELKGGKITGSKIGVYNYKDSDDGNKASFIINGGEISGNETGVWTNYYRTRIFGGKITGNKIGVDVAITGDEKWILMEGSPCIKDNTDKDVYLRNGTKIVPIGKLTKKDEPQIGVNLDNESGTGVFTMDYTDLHANDSPRDFFFCSDSGLEVMSILDSDNAKINKTVKYVDASGAEQDCYDYKNIEDEHEGKYTGWYVVDGTFTLDTRMPVNGKVYLIITDGSTFEAKNGISVGPGNSLYVYGQTNCTGKLIANENKKAYCAGIGGDDEKACGEITINGARITAYGGTDAAGIGGGNQPSNGNQTGKITVNRGVVYAYGGNYGAGIGGGDRSDGGTITINGGTVESYGGQDAAGLGGGDGDGNEYGNGGTITINGGKVTATAFEYEYNYNDKVLGAGLGGGQEGGAGTITITGGTVSATGQRGGAGIGSGCDVNKKSNQDYIGGTITISGGTVSGISPAPTEVGTTFGGGAGIGSGRNSPGCKITISGGKVFASGSTKKKSEVNYEGGGAGIGSAQDSKGGSIKITGGTIEAFTACNKAAPIGTGENSSSSPKCTLDYDGCKVWSSGIDGSSKILFSAEERAANAFKTADVLGRKYMHIEPCDHPDLSYTSDETKHTAGCSYCGNTITEEHKWKLENKGEQHQEVCSVCGYEGDLSDHVFDQADDKCLCGANGIRIHFEANGGSGEMKDVIIHKGDSYTLPECSFTAPEGKQFTGWLVSPSTSGKVSLPGHTIYKPQETVTLTAQWDEIWHGLQVMIDNAENGDTIVLDRDYNAGPDDVEYIVESGKEITIDLNGHTIDRALSTQLQDAEDKGGVFRVEGTLTITDSKGTGIIQGGSPETYTGSPAEDFAFKEVGGAFNVDGGTLTIKGGTIQKCAATAGAVWLTNKATFNLEGGTITDTGGYSSIITVDGGSTFNMSGGEITKNKISPIYPEQPKQGNAVVYVEDGSFKMSGGSITENDGGLWDSASSKILPLSAVVMGADGSFAVSGDPVISENGYLTNVAGTEQVIRNVYLATGQKVTVTGTLSSDAAIGVTVADEPEEGATRVLTSGLGGKGASSVFTYDTDDYTVSKNADREAVIGSAEELKVTISFDAKDGTPAPKDQTIAIDSKVTEPEDPIKDGYKFTGWYTDEDCTNAFDFDSTVDADMTLYAGWECDHEWSAATYVWSDDNSKVTATRTCSRDRSHVETETVETTSEVTKAATCEGKGETTYTSATFENTAFTVQTKTVEDIDALGHDWDDGVVTKAPTCEEEGVKTYTCKHDSSHTKTEDIEIDPKAHDWDEGEITKEPTCTEKGIITYTCALCDATETEEIPVDADAHDWDEGTVTTEPTCTEKGVKTYTCNNDASHTKTEEIAIDPDAHDWDEGTVTKEPTCAETGTKEYTCKNDGSHTKTEELAIDPDAHDWDEGTVTKEPTCTEKGVKTYTCNNDSSHTKTEDVAALGHDYQDVEGTGTPATCTEAGVSADQKCSRCGDEVKGTEIAALGHSWGEWKTVKEATNAAAGEKQRTCSVCGEVETQTIAKLNTTKTVLVAKGIAKGKRKAVISWNNVKADRYVVYIAKCNYNTKKYKFKKVKTLSGKKFKYTTKSLKKNRCYKFKVVAQKKVNGKYKKIATSYEGHFCTANVRGSLTNPKSMTLNKTEVTLTKGSTFTISAKIAKVKNSKKLATTHTKLLRYKSDNPTVATVNASGKVTAKSPGTATIYVQTINGIWKTVKVTVK